jgi:N-acetylmuramoyl-L-alanine amidase
VIICVDPGHGGKDPGAVFHGTNEKDIALTVALMLKVELEKKGHQVVMTRTDDQFITLAERCRISNRAQVDRFVSIHLNADADPDAEGMREARGYEILHAEGSVRGKWLATTLDSLLLEQHSIPSRGVKARDRLYVLNRTNAPAVLVELGFIDSRSERLVLKDPLVQRRLAQLLAQGLSYAYPGSSKAAYRA